jgi:hypothetical protein
MRIVYRVGELYIEQIDHDVLELTVVSSNRALSTKLHYEEIEDLARTSLIMLMDYYMYQSRVESERLKELQDDFEEVMAGKRYGNPDGLQERIREKQALLATLKKRIEAIEALLKTFEETGKKG